VNIYPTPVGPAGPIILLAGLLLFLALLTIRDRQPKEAGESGRSTRSIVGIVVQMLGFVAVGAGPITISLRATSAAAIGQAAIVLLLVAITCGLFAASRRAMGRNWSLVARTRSDHQLVTAGPFAYVRHPIYSALFAWLLAMAVGFGHYRGLIVGVPLYWLGTWLRVAEEEKLLRAHFGQAYDAYAARVKRFLPGIV
jgi:protein-S-isoprenylcysteine O-methyltransferase Ste14